MVEAPFEATADLDRLRPLDIAADVPHVIETVRIATQALEPLGVPLIGFAGGPFTVASYLDRRRPVADLYEDLRADAGRPRHLDGTARSSRRSRRRPCCARRSRPEPPPCSSSTAGPARSRPCDYEQFVLPASRRVLARLADLGVPRIHFGVGTGELLRTMGEAGAEVVGVDWRVPLDVARERVGPGRALQGNLDPDVCLAPWPVVEAAATDVLRRGGGAGHIFNLGHGVLPETDPDVLHRIVDLVHSLESAVSDTAGNARDAAVSNAEIGVLVMAHGTPPSLDDLEAFVTEIRRGRPAEPELLAELERRYVSDRRHLPSRREDPLARRRARRRPR